MWNVIVVAHDETAWELTRGLARELEEWADDPYELIVHDNRKDNIGFARAVNLAARRGEGDYIALLNPDTKILGPFLAEIRAVLETGSVQITGCRWGKAERELKMWGVKDWVCGAAFFTTREWWNFLGGFDEQFVWSYEETDFIRRTEALAGRCESMILPLAHLQDEDDEAERKYKQKHICESAVLYERKWAGRPKVHAFELRR